MDEKTDEEIIRSHYGEALRRWKPTERNTVFRQPVRLPVPSAIVPRDFSRPVSIYESCVEYRLHTGLLGDAPMYRVTGRYRDTEIEVDFGRVEKR